jgi:hypothetical protein
MPSWVSLLFFCTPSFPRMNLILLHFNLLPHITTLRFFVFLAFQSLPAQPLPHSSYQFLPIMVLVFLAIQTLTAFFSALSRTVSSARYHYGRSHLDIIPHSFKFHTSFSFIFSDLYHTLSITYLLPSLSCTFILALYLDWVRYYFIYEQSWDILLWLQY